MAIRLERKKENPLPIPWKWLVGLFVLLCLIPSNFWTQLSNSQLMFQDKETQGVHVNDVKNDGCDLTGGTPKWREMSSLEAKEIQMIEKCKAILPNPPINWQVGVLNQEGGVRKLHM